MSQQKTERPFNLEEGIRKCFNQRDLFEQTVDSFLEEADPLMKQIHSALERGDAAELARLAHRLRGTVTYLAAGPASDAAGRLEEIGISGKKMRDARSAVAVVEQEISRLRAALAEYRSGK